MVVVKAARGRWPMSMHCLAVGSVEVRNNLLAHAIAVASEPGAVDSRSASSTSVKAGEG
jgi:hypothetical protein